MQSIKALNRIISGPVRFSLKGINPEKIGVYLKDGSINFKDQATAIEYGINRCSASVQGRNPFERLVNIKGSRVIQEIQGDAEKVATHNTTEVMIHSHPDIYAKGCTCALSDADYESFISRKCIKKMLAVNSNGEYYQMEKIPGFDFSKVDTQSTFSDFNIKMRQMLYCGKDAPSEQKSVLEECHRRKDLDYYYDNWVDKFIVGNTSVFNWPKYKVDGTHEFWVNFGELFGVKTKTNFSNFISPS